MRTDYLLGLSAHGFHKIHYTDWGDPASKRVVICVHGLTRNCRDFDFLARALAHECRVVCPDVVGRGRSDWLDHKDDYANPQYTADMNALMARVTEWPVPSGWLGRLANFLTRRYGSRSVYWVGTSMGGIIGMLLASRPKSPIRKLVVNDIGPLIPKAALERIATYVGKDPRFRTYDELEAYVRKISAPFGPLDDAQWRHLTSHAAKQYADGSWGMCYDPGITAPLRKGPLEDINLWSYWDTIFCPTLALRGAESDLLLKDTADEMQKRGPRARLVEFAGVGHAPMLLAEDQIRVVTDFLLAPE
jgi:pimeloyl-ACP methyl ester carboxylesterase